MSKDKELEPIPEWVSTEIKKTWRAATDGVGQTQAYRILERMVSRLGYNRREDPPLF